MFHLLCSRFVWYLIIRMASKFLSLVSSSHMLLDLNPFQLFAPVTGNKCNMPSCHIFYLTVMMSLLVLVNKCFNFTTISTSDHYHHFWHNSTTTFLCWNWEETTGRRDLKVTSLNCSCRYVEKRPTIDWENCIPAIITCSVPLIVK